MTSLLNTTNALLQNKEAIVLQGIGVLRVSGMDAKKFLQGQITCDINKLTADSGLYGAICSIKGRIITNFYLIQKDDDVLMLMNKDLVETSLLHLKKYAVFFKTELTNENNVFSVHEKISLGHQVSRPEKLAETLSVNNTDEQISVTLSEYPVTVQWLINDSTSSVQESNTELSALSLLTARPLISLEQSETTLPQWLNMQQTGGISFTKGCYTGQEIVARMQYKGKSKKQLALFEWSESLDTTQEIMDDQGKTLGQIFKSAAFGNTYFAQAIINVDPTEINAWFLDNTQITQLPLPYALEPLR